VTNSNPSHRASRAARLLPVAGLTVVLAASRLPFLDHPTPAHPDEIAFQAALGFPHDYPVHAPGYPLWIALGTIARYFGTGSYTSFAVWSFLASIIGPLLLYRFLARRLDARVAWFTAIAFGLCPLAWFHSVTALTYWAATVIGLVIVDGCANAVESERFAPRLVAACALGVGVFLRTDCIVYFGPLFAYALWRRRSLQSALCAIIPVVALVGFYILAQFLYNRGESPLFDARFGHSRSVLLGTSVFRQGLIDGLARNLLKIGVNLGWNLAPLAAGFLLSLAFRARRSNAPGRNGDLMRVVVWWLAPGLAFLALFHVVEGYFLWLLPAFFIAGAVWLQQCSSKVATRMMAAVALVSIAQFLAYPWSSSSTGVKRTIDAKIAYLSAAGLRSIDQRHLIHDVGDFWRTGAQDRRDEGG